MVEIIDPTARHRAGASALAAEAARPTSLAGLRIGLLENTKHNAAGILAALGDELASRHDIDSLVPLTKTMFAMPLPADLIEQLIAECDVVVLGVGDCGSCSASAVADGIALERIGIPTAVICTDSFIGASEAMAGLKGAPEFPFLRTAHPIANLSDDGVVERGRSLAASVEGRLLGDRVPALAS